MTTNVSDDTLSAIVDRPDFNLAQHERAATEAYRRALAAAGGFRATCGSLAEAWREFQGRRRAAGNDSPFAAERRAFHLRALRVALDARQYFEGMPDRWAGMTFEQRQAEDAKQGTADTEARNQRLMAASQAVVDARQPAGTAQSLLAHLAAKGVVLSVVSGTVYARPAVALNDTDRASLRQLRAELVNVLGEAEAFPA